MGNEKALAIGLEIHPFYICPCACSGNDSVSKLLVFQSSHRPNWGRGTVCGIGADGVFLFGSHHFSDLTGEIDYQ